MKNIITSLFILLLFFNGTSQTTVFLEDFESGTLNSFAAGNNVNSLTWQTTTNRGADLGHSSSNSAYFGNPATFDYNTANQEGSELTSSVINLSGYLSASLTLNYFLETENAMGFDVASVQVSTDAITYTTLADNSTVGSITETAGLWQSLSIDLSSYVGGNIYLRLAFDSQDNVSNGFEGFYVDDIQVEVIDVNSSFMYNKTIGTANGELIRDASVTSDGGLILIGDYDYGITSADVIKVDVFGDVIWSKNLVNNISSPYSFKNIEQTSDGGYVALGEVGGGTGVGAVGTQDMCVFKMDASGDYSWSKGYGDNAASEDVNSSGGRLMSGDNMLLYGNITRSGAFIVPEPVVMKLNSIGDTLWTSIFENELTILQDVIELSNGDILAVGDNGSTVSTTLYYMDANGSPVWTVDVWLDSVVKVMESSSGNLLLLGGDVLFGNNMDVALVALDFSGNFMFSERYGSSNHIEIGKDIIETTDGGYAIVAADNSTGTQKFGLYKLDAARNLEWAKAYGGVNPSDPVFIQETPSGDFVMAGYTEAFGIGLADAYLVRTDSGGLTVGCQEVLTNILHQGRVETYSSSPFSIVRGALYNNFPGIVSFLNLTTIDDFYPIISITSSDPLCNGGLGSAFVNVNGGVNPFTYSWSSGIASQTLTGAPAGTYSVVVTGNDGCVVHDTTTLVEPSSIATALTATDVDCFANFNGAVDLTVSGGTPGYTYQWANGATTEDISGVGGGFYQVSVMDANGCQFSQGITVFEPGPLNAGISGTQNISCFGLCDGSAAAIASGGTSPYTYLWNDSQSQTTSTASSLCEGSLLVTVTDANNCTAFANTIVIEPNELTATISTVPSECGIAIGTADAAVSGGTGTITYSWSSGGSASTEGGLIPGNYDVDIIDANGCSINESFGISSSAASVEMCVVTVDSNNKNLIVWEKPLATNLAGFNIYRNIAGVYTQVGYQPYDSLSQFVDNDFGVDPNVTSYRYKIAVLDSCGNESELSDFHETIHLTASNGLGGVVNLIWDDYEGFAFSEYEIWRDTTGNGDWETINTVLSTNFTYVDNTVPSSSSTLRYAIEVVMPSTCTSTKAQDHNTTRSNRHTILGPNGGGTSINELILSQINIFPNPSRGIFQVNVKSDNWSYSLFDISGKLISGEDVLKNNTTVNIEDLETGVYLMRINLDNDFVYKKIVKE